MSSLKLKHSGGNSVSLNPPTSAPTSSDVAFKLPNADGSANQLLKTDGSGNLGWIADVGLFKNWNYTTDNTHVTLQAGGDTYSQLNTAITPSSADSRILVIVNLGLVSSDSTADVGWDICRGDTGLEQGQSGTVNSTAGAFMNEGDGWAVSSTAFVIDHPNTTSSVTYKVKADQNGGRDMIINKRGSNTSLCVSSRMLLIEIGNKS
jgi:hypothetical protein